MNFTSFILDSPKPENDPQHLTQNGFTTIHSIDQLADP